MEPLYYEAVSTLVTGWLMSHRTGRAVEDDGIFIVRFTMFGCILRPLGWNLGGLYVSHHRCGYSLSIVRLPVCSQPDDGTGARSPSSRHRWSGSRTCSRIFAAVAS